MVIKPEQERVRSLIADTVSLLCKNGLNYTKEFSIEGLLGITLDSDEVFLVNIKEVVKMDLGNDDGSSDASESAVSHSSKKKRRRKRKNKETDSSNEEDATSNFAQENSSSLGEPPAKNIKQEEEDEDEDDLVFVKDEPGASGGLGACSFGGGFPQPGAQNSILGDMSQQGQLFATPTSDPLPGPSQWDPSSSQSNMFSPPSQSLTSAPGTPGQQVGFF